MCTEPSGDCVARTSRDRVRYRGWNARINRRRRIQGQRRRCRGLGGGERRRPGQEQAERERRPSGRHGGAPEAGIDGPGDCSARAMPRAEPGSQPARVQGRRGASPIETSRGEGIPPGTGENSRATQASASRGLRRINPCTIRSSPAKRPLRVSRMTTSAASFHQVLVDDQVAAFARDRVEVADPTAGRRDRTSGGSAIPARLASRVKRPRIRQTPTIVSPHIVIRSALASRSGRAGQPSRGTTRPAVPWPV